MRPQVKDNWKCSYCGHAQVIANGRFHNELQTIYVDEWEAGDAGYYLESIVCANAECRKMTLFLSLVVRGKYHKHSSNFEIRSVFKEWQLLPSSVAKPQPNYIPDVLRR